MIADNIRQLDDCANEILQIKNWINRNQMDSNVRYLTAYAVVKASGTIELVMKSMVCDYLADQARTETQNFLTRNIIDASFNPSTSKIAWLIEQFDSSKVASFNTQVSGEQNIKSQLNSLVSLRNDIAHGRTITASISTIETYYGSGRRVLQILDSLLV